MYLAKMKTKMNSNTLRIYRKQQILMEIRISRMSMTFHYQMTQHAKIIINDLNI